MSDVNVDSANTTAIEYDSYGSGQWQLIKTDNNGAIFAQTLTRVQSTGGAVFRFHGTQVQVYGSVSPPTDPGATVTSSYTVDGAHAGSFSSNSVPASLVSEQDGQLFFDSGKLDDGDHVLVINVTLASAAEPFLLDYIKYAATTPSSSTTSTSSAGPTATDVPNSRSSSHSNVGPIVGGVVGGVLGAALLTAIALFLFFRYFRHRISLSGRRPGGPDLVEDLVENGKPGSETDPSSTGGPFMSETSASPPWRAGTPSLPFAPPPAPSTVGPDDSASQVAGRIYAAELAQQQQAHAGGSSGLSSGSGSGPGASARGDRKQRAVAEEPEPEPEAVQHQDSGIRFRDGDVPPGVPELGNGIDERPPEYTPAS